MDIPKVKAKWTSYLCAFNIAEVLILELMPWSTCFRCIINVLCSIQYFCCFQVSADAAILNLSAGGRS